MPDAGITETIINHHSRAADNINSSAKDRENKERGNRNNGEDSGSARLTWIQVREIRYKYNYENYTQQQLSDEYKISRPNIAFIIQNKAWYDSNYIRINFRKANSKTHEGSTVCPLV